MQVHVDEIIVKDRIRKNLGDLSRLMASMQTHGLLNPIIITSGYRLIAGHRRLESAKRLGWPTVEAVVMNDIGKIDELEIELDENLYRKALTPDELADGYERLEKLKTPPFVVRFRRSVVAFLKRLFGRRS